MNDDNEDFFEDDDDKRERDLESVDQEAQYTEEEKQFLEECIKNHLKDFENILNQIDEGIDRIDSYERTMEIKRSIDRLIETLYSQAASEDIDAELEFTTHTRDKSASMKRIRERRRKRDIEAMLSNMFAEQQKNITNSKHLGHGHETEKAADVHEAKEQVKYSIKRVLFLVIGNKMDPRRRAGETADDNERGAKIYGREAADGALGALLKTFLTAVIAVVNEIVKPLQQHANKQETSFAKQVQESRNTDPQKGHSI